MKASGEAQERTIEERILDLLVRVEERVARVEGILAADPTAEPEPTLLTAGEFAARAGCTTKRIRAMRAEGRLRAVRVGARALRFPVSELRRLEREAR